MPTEFLVREIGLQDVLVLTRDFPKQAWPDPVWCAEVVLLGDQRYQHRRVELFKEAMSFQFRANGFLGLSLCRKRPASPALRLLLTHDRDATTFC